MNGSTIRIAICDDDNRELAQTLRTVNDYFDHRFAKENIEILSFATSVALLAKIEEGKHFDIYLLDVLMPVVNGIELARSIRTNDNSAKIIFLSSSSEFALDSYSVGAFNYLLKPVQKEALFTLLEKICNKMYHQPKPCIVIRTQSGLYKVFFHELMYVEVIKRTTYFYLKNELTIESILPITQVELELLRDSRFVKPHRSYIINLEYVKALTKDGFTMINGRSIPISRNVLKEIKQKYIDHAFLMPD
jgi:DNA-binding LytR/AlgR family response regulator